MLTIYRASAGAGKTHRLTGEYLLLLFSRPGAYRRILAVTFTNKATDEMKRRIVEELHCLASGEKSDYITMLGSYYSLTEEQVRKQAKQILIAILHDYSAFNISTIDRFFQQTMRAFTREIGLQGGYGIEMDEELVLSEAVDRMLNDLDKSGNKELLGWLLHFAKEKIEDGKEWNLRSDIKELGGELFKESYKQFSDAVSKDIEDKQSLEDYKEALFSIIRSVEKEVKELGEKALEVMQAFGLKPSDFISGSRSPMLFFQRCAEGEMKEPTATFRKLADNKEKCYAKKTTEPEIQQIIGAAFENGLNDCIKDIITRFDNLTAYHSAKEIIRYYYTLGILTDISREIASYREEKNIMLIADATELLHKVIDGSDAPFIYEKTGTQIDHFMIDEFQDTSAMQWSNFRPLIEESLAHNRLNLIVGDVKQSIYRFRNSDWKLLEGQVQKDFPPEEICEETLKDNWRSCRNIVEFNNAFFTIAPALLQDSYNTDLAESSLDEAEQKTFASRITEAYKGASQRIPEQLWEKAGHVRIEFIPQEEIDWKEESLKRLPEILQRLQTNGFALKDIALLVRTNSESVAVARYLLSYKEAHADDGFCYDIISDEALYVNSASSVRFLVALMRYLQQPEHQMNKQLALFAYRILIGEWNTPDFSSNEKQTLHQLATLPIYEMAEGLFRLFAAYIPQTELVFVQAYLDRVADFVRNESSDLGQFLEWWDERGSRKAIATPDGQNAIRILTVHKSKGLGFRAVILPFANWEIDHKSKKTVILWCRPKQRPFNQLHLVPVHYGTDLRKSIFARDYFNEKLHAFIDNLNTLYVALTRAKEELIVMAPRPKNVNNTDNSSKKIGGIADLLWYSVQHFLTDTDAGGSTVLPAISFNLKENCYEVGNYRLWQKNSKPQAEELHVEQLCSISQAGRLHLRLRGKDFFFDNEQRKYGRLMHEVLSGVRTPEDIPSAVRTYRMQGVIIQDEEVQLIQQLQNYLQLPAVKRWYDGQAHILNEVDILFEKIDSKRPDRVMLFDKEVVILDYKFGEKKSPNYQTQVRSYIHLVQQMGYSHVSGFIWYVTLGEIVPVQSV